jgi:flavin-dependent dehydrogenase
MPPVVLGAGPAGCAAAIALARAGASPVLLDRDSSARDQLCGGFLSWRTVKQLRALGIDPDALGGKHAVELAVFAGPRDVTVPLPGISFGLSRRTLDEAMRSAAIRCGACFKVEHARGLDGTAVIGHDRRWDGDGLFLATGKHDLRGEARPRASDDAALGVRLRLPAAPERAALLNGRIELHLFDGGYAGIVLQEDGTANVCMALRKSALGRAGGDPCALLARLGEAHPAFGERLGHDWRTQPIDTIGAVPYGWIARAPSDGLFRLGDQAAVIPSLAGEGISIALASGTAAARHWLERGAAGAAGYQREMAARVSAPVGIARLVWAAAERPVLAGPALAACGMLPALPRLLMRLSRVRGEPALARPRLAP